MSKWSKRTKEEVKGWLLVIGLLGVLILTNVTCAYM